MCYIISRTKKKEKDITYRISDSLDSTLTTLAKDFKGADGNCVSGS
jgi:hypothetical protein